MTPCIFIVYFTNKTQQAAVLYLYSSSSRYHRSTSIHFGKSLEELDRRGYTSKERLFKQEEIDILTRKTGACNDTGSNHSEVTAACKHSGR
jgi:hypothetical protein